MKFLIDTKSKLVIGSYRHRLDGWIFIQFSSAHKPSRKCHATPEEASSRFFGPSRSIIEAHNWKHATAIAEDRA